MWEIIIKAAALSDVGDTRPNNQDSILYKTGIIGNRRVGLFIVADGMGGLELGEEMSGLVTICFHRFWDTEINALINPKSIKDDEINKTLEKVIAEINELAISFGRKHMTKSGTTLSLLLTVDSKYYVKNVGDSRVYLVRKNQIIQLTEDQSLVAQLVRNQEISAEDAKYHRDKNILTMCIGVADEVKTNTHLGKIRDKDVFIVCSDGFYNCTSDDEVMQIINKRQVDTKDKVALLRQTIPLGQARDNVSIILVEYFFKFSLFT